MKRFIAFIIVLCSVAFMGMSQNIIHSLEQSMPGQGKVSIHQDERIAALLGSASSSAASRTSIKRAGYRVQVFAGNNTRVSKNEAYSIASKVKAYFPELTVYTTFSPPRWLCRVGDYRSIEEADAMMRRLRATKEFKEVLIVKDQIQVSF